MLNRRGWVVVAVAALLAAVPASADSTEVDMDTVCVDRPCPIAPISAPSRTRVLSPIIADEDYVLVNLAKDSEDSENPTPPAEEDPPPPAEEDPPPTEDEPPTATSTRRTPEKTSTKDKPTPTSTKKKDEATTTRKAEPVTPRPRPTRTGSASHVHPTSTSALGSKKPIETDSPDPEDSLTSTYPPSSARKKWGLAIGFMALLTLLGVAWSYRSSLPLHIPSYHLPSLNLKLLTGKGYIPLPSSPKSRRHTRRRSKPFRPTPSSLLTWARDTPSSKWTVGELDDEEGYIGESEEGYEEVGLLPSPAPWRRGQGQGQGVKEQRSYGSFSNA